MDNRHFDTLIIGGGAMGTAAALHLARRGNSVAVLEQFHIGHELGSSTGISRIIRRAYFEHPDYVPLVERAYELWHSLERESGESLLTVTGIVEMGSPAGTLLNGSLLSCRQHGIPHERLTAKEIRHRYPQFHVPDWMEGVWQRDAGILAVERCVQTQARMARRLGAAIFEDTPALELTNAPEVGIEVRTPRGTFTGERAIVCAGAWSARLLADLKLPLIVTRQTQGFYVPDTPAEFTPASFPLWLMDLPGHNFYGFPIFGAGAIKIAHHHGGEIVQPDAVDRNFNAADDRQLREFMKEYIPRANGKLLMGKICMYTNTPDHDFIVDAHPSFPNVWIAAGFSGHGFKFAPVMGEILAQLVMDGSTNFPVDRFKLGRLAPN